MVLNFRRKWAYSQEEIDEQISQVKILMQMRKSSQMTEEVKRFDLAIEMAQEVLGFMLDKVRGFQSGKSKN